MSWAGKWEVSNNNNNNNNNNNGLYCTDKLHIMCYNITMYKSRITIQSSRKLKIYKNIDTNLTRLTLTSVLGPFAAHLLKFILH